MYVTALRCMCTVGAVLTFILWCSRSLAADSSGFSADILKCGKDLLNNDVSDLDKLSHADEICYNQAHEQARLNDFILRRTPYAEQPYFDIIILAMVVIITLSGVGLAALQLYASYRLAVDDRSTNGNSFKDAKAKGSKSPNNLKTGSKTTFNTSSTMTLSTTKATLSSSVVGLFILLISLGFFMIYARYVYPIVENGAGNSGGLLPDTRDKGSGGLGFPPGPKKQQ